MGKERKGGEARGCFSNWMVVGLSTRRRHAVKFFFGRAIEMELFSPVYK